MKALAIITGILTIILGIYAMCVPFRVFLGIGWVLGALVLLGGIELAVISFSKKKNIALGILGVIVAICGIVLLVNGVQRFATDLFVAYLIGAAIAVSGIYLIIAGVKTLKQSKGHGILNIIFGILEVILGILSISHPILTMISVGYIIAANVIMQGISFTALGIAMGKEAKA